MSPSQTSTAAHADISTESASMRPAETASSYFPKDATASTLVSTSSTATPTETPIPIEGGSAASAHPLSPLDREYAEPMQDFDITQQLSKQPAYWSLAGWLQRSASSDTEAVREDPAARARKFEEAKRELLASAGRF
ncbi:hypothetical protein F5Y08DRAFT_294006 [Xylaria arbuscula]|nr:hypothetical protein F5Y08DRAFT_294006 [Xylaria arbuscula]